MKLQLQLRDDKDNVKTLLQDQISSLVSDMKVELDAAIKKDGKKAPNLAKIFLDGIGKHKGICLARCRKGAVLVIAGANVNIAHPVKSVDVEQAIEAILFKLGQPVNDRTVAPIRSALLASATHGDDAQKINVYEYNALSSDGGVYLDMRRGDGRALKISSKGIEQNPKNEGITFIYDSAIGSRPIPQPAINKGPLLRRYMSNLEAHDFQILVAYITFAWCHPLRAGLTLPMLQLSGSAGMGKTTLTRLLMTLIAPREDMISDATGKHDDMTVLAQTDRAIAMDNTEVAAKKISNLLCGMATATSVKAREMYTNDRMVSMPLHNLVITNGILGMAGRHDLLSRAIPIKVIKPKVSFPSDTAMMEEFNRDLPAIFYWLLKVSVHCLKVKSANKKIVTTSTHRARDFVNWLACLEHVFFKNKGPEMVNALQTRLDELMEVGMDDITEQNHLVAAVLELMEDKPEWRGSPSELYEQLTDIPDFAVTSSRAWPNSASSMSSRLKQDESLLNKQRVSLDSGRGKTRWILLTNANPTSEPISNEDDNSEIEALLNT